jgi:hypothetical protein
VAIRSPLTPDGIKLFWVPLSNDLGRLSLREKLLGHRPITRRRRFNGVTRKGFRGEEPKLLFGGLLGGDLLELAAPV